MFDSYKEEIAHFCLAYAGRSLGNFIRKIVWIYT